MNPGDNAPGDENSADEVLKRHVLKTLRECKNNRTATARKLGWNRQNLYNQIKRWGLTLEFIDPSRPGSDPPKK
jgi:DNA-binding NtrC family response regulator